MKLFLIYEDEVKREFSIDAPVRYLIDVIRKGEVETIVFGDVKDDEVVWEKQFSAVTVMPTSFGKVK
jgi:hypothetical protein